MGRYKFCESTFCQLFFLSYVCNEAKGAIQSEWYEGGKDDWKPDL